MHGRRKDEYQRTHLARSQAEKEAAKNKVFKYKQLMELALQQRQEMRHCKEALVTGEALNNDLVLSSQLLRINPDVYTLWNHRKEMIVASGVIRQEAEGGETEKEECESEREGGKAPLPPGSFLQTELDLVIDCIRKNPKSYGAWHHRRWLLDHAFSLSPSAAPPNPSSPVAPLPALSRQLKPVLDRELFLCAKLLDLDERNFHCWSYRRWVVSKHPARTPRDEFEFSTSRILKNFSNYSAFHHRASYFWDYLREAHPNLDPPSFLERELDMVQQAVFTEPDDQTAWWYHQHLISLALAWDTEREKELGERGDQESTPRGVSFAQRVLEKEVKVLRELVEEGEAEGGGYRWAVLTLADLLGKLARRKEGKSEEASLRAESQKLLKRLPALDPDHAGRYQDMLDSLP